MTESHKQSATITAIPWATLLTPLTDDLKLDQVFKIISRGFGGPLNRQILALHEVMTKQTLGQHMINREGGIRTHRPLRGADCQAEG